MKCKLYLIDLTYILSFIYLSNASQCPPASISYPLECLASDDSSYKDLTCGQNYYYNTTLTAIDISNYFSSNPEEKQFRQLNFINLNILSLEVDAFYDLKFSTFISLKPDNKILNKIHQNAFSASRLTMTKFFLWDNHIFDVLGSPYNIFNFLNSMTALSEVYIYDSNINEIPGKTLNGFNLSILDLTLNKINDYGYKYLVNLQEIDITGTFNFIPSHAFTIENFNTDIKLKIKIYNSSIDSMSFESGVFTNPNRTLNLYFESNPKLTYLDQNIFETLLDNYTNSNIYFVNNPMDCEACNLLWIFHRKSELIPFINNAECIDGQSFYDLNVVDFKNCTEFDETTTTSDIISTITPITTMATTLPTTTLPTTTTPTTMATTTTITPITTTTINNSVNCNSNNEYDGEYGISHWPEVSEGELSYGKCNYGNGFAKWMCHKNGKFDINGPDFSDCWLDSVDIEINNITDVNEVIEILETIAENTENYDSLNNSDELKVIIYIIKRLQNFIETDETEINYENSLNLTKSFVNVFNNLINQRNAWLNSTESEKSEIASDILLYIQYTSFTLSCNQNISNPLEVINNKNIILNTYHTNFSQQLSFESNGSSIIIPKDVKFDSTNSCNNSAFGALISGLENYLFKNIENELEINTEIIAFSITNSNKSIQFNDGLKARMSLEHKNRLKFGDKIVCMFWDYMSMKWSTNGCQLVFKDSNRDYSVCECNHLTNFAAIMDLSGRERNELSKSILTIICCTISIISLLLTILLILFTKKGKSNSITESLTKMKNMITCNVCLCLLISDLIVIFGMDRTENKSLCKTASGFLLYSLLASFSWMLLEGFHLYRITVNVFTSYSNKYYVIGFGYGVPFVIFFFSLLMIYAKENVFFDALIGDYFCWISSEKHSNHIWIIIIPVLVVTIINGILLYISWTKIFPNNKNSKFSNNKKKYISFTAIICNLGFTWLLFILYSQSFGSFFSYLFILLNGLQGFFIFLYHLALFHNNYNIRKMFRRMSEELFSTFYSQA